MQTLGAEKLAALLRVSSLVLFVSVDQKNNYRRLEARNQENNYRYRSCWREEINPLVQSVHFPVSASEALEERRGRNDRSIDPFDGPIAVEDGHTMASGTATQSDQGVAVRSMHSAPSIRPTADWTTPSPSAVRTAFRSAGHGS